jgi:hypothetical protein
LGWKRAICKYEDSE